MDGISKALVFNEHHLDGFIYLYRSKNLFFHQTPLLLIKAFIGRTSAWFIMNVYSENTNSTRILLIENKLLSNLILNNFWYCQLLTGALTYIWIHDTPNSSQTPCKNDERNNCRAKPHILTHLFGNAVWHRDACRLTPGRHNLFGNPNLGKNAGASAVLDLQQRILIISEFIPFRARSEYLLALTVISVWLILLILRRDDVLVLFPICFFMEVGWIMMLLEIEYH